MKSSFWEKRKILLSVTSFRVDPFDFVRQANELKITEAALFLTGLKKIEERKKLYQDLEKSSIKNIPCVHLIAENEEWELDYLIKKFNTEVFNFHSQREYALKNDISKYNKIIFIENIYNYPLDEDEIKKYGGICIDISHLEKDRIFDKEKYENDLSVLKRFKIGFNHVSPFNLQNEKIGFDDSEKYLTKTHVMENLNQFDYLKNYPEEIFGPYLALEVRNDIYEQVKIKEYIQKLLSND